MDTSGEARTRFGDTASDELLSVLISTGMLRYDGLAVILDAVRNNAFDSRSITLESAEETFMRRIRARHSKMEKDDAVWGVGLPRVVLQAVVDHLVGVIDEYVTWKGKFAFDVFDECDLIPSKRKGNHAASLSILKVMSRVHSSWTPMVYRVLGRSLSILPDNAVGQDLQWSTTFASQLHGPWTRRLGLVIKREISKSQAAQRMFYLSKVSLRFPYLQTLVLDYSPYTTTPLSLDQFFASLNVDHVRVRFDSEASHSITPGKPFSDKLFGSIAKLAHLRSLHLMYTTIQPFIEKPGIPGEIGPIVASPSFNEFQITFEKPRVNKELADLMLNASKLSWRKCLEGRLVLSCVKLEGFSRSLSRRLSELAQNSGVTGVDEDNNEVGHEFLKRWHREIPGRIRVRSSPPAFNWNDIVQNLEITHFSYVTAWLPTGYSLVHCEQLREFTASVWVEDLELIEAIFNSLPKSLELLSLAVATGLEFTKLDHLLSALIASERVPNLKRLRLLRLREGNADPAHQPPFMRMKVANAIPETVKLCDPRRIEYVVWR